MGGGEKNIMQGRVTEKSCKEEVKKKIPVE